MYKNQFLFNICELRKVYKIMYYFYSNKYIRSLIKLYLKYIKIIFIQYI